MSHQFIQEQVDIYQLPSIDENHLASQGTQITIGDMHGNAMKLMFMLVKHGIARNLTQEDYNRLVELYRTPVNDLKKQHLAEFNNFLSKIEFRKDSLIRLIGDELADRGNNDYFTLKILEKLHQNAVPVEILVSNHSIEFIEAYEKQKDFHAPMLSRGGHAPSVEKLQILVEKGLVTRKEILKLADQSYKPTLRAISYSLSADRSEINIFSHAGIGLDSIKNLALKLNVEYKDATALELAQTIDIINEVFQVHVQNNTVHTLYDREKMYIGYQNAPLIDAPFEFIMWNRFYHNIERPADHSGYRVNFVHGHDSKDATYDNIYNLDNDLGKLENMNQGGYTVLYAPEGEITAKHVFEGRDNSKAMDQSHPAHDENSFSLSNDEKPSSSPLDGINMMVLGGFVTALGIAAVAVAFVVLNALTFGTLGLAVAAVGIASTLVGVGIFGAGALKNRAPDNVMPSQNELAFNP